MAFPLTSRKSLDDNPKSVVTTGKTVDSPERWQPGQGGVASRAAALEREHSNNATKNPKETYPQGRPRGGENEHPERTDFLTLIKSARTASAPGPSGVLYKVFKHCPRLLEGLWKIFEENSRNIEQFKTISLLSVECKTFFKIISNRLMGFLLKNTYFDTSVQKGGFPGVPGCIEHTGMVTQLIREARESRGDLAILWLELANAYGSIPHKLVELSLSRYRVQEKIRNLILNYYKNFSLRVSSGPLNIRVASSGERHHYRLRELCVPVCTGHEYAREICRSRVQRSCQIWHSATPD